MRTFHTPKGRAGADLVDAMEESAHSHLEQMFAQCARRDSLAFGVGRTLMKFQDTGGAGRLEAQRRECEGQIVSHAGRALELALHIIHARGADRIIGRGYPGMTQAERDQDFKDGHSLVALRARIIHDLDKPRLADALESAYQTALHKGVTDIYVKGDHVASLFLSGEAPFTELSTSRLADGEEHTMDHSSFRDLFARPDGTSSFASMPIDSFEQFLAKTDAVYYEDDTPRRSGQRRNMRWGNYSARDHEIARPFVTVGVRFFGRLVQALVQLGGEPWTWHEDFLDRVLARRRYTIMERLKILASQNLVEEVQWPEMIGEAKMLEYYMHPYTGPSVGHGVYSNLHAVWKSDERAVPENGDTTHREDPG